MGRLDCFRLKNNWKSNHTIKSLKNCMKQRTPFSLNIVKSSRTVFDVSAIYEFKKTELRCQNPLLVPKKQLHPSSGNLDSQCFLSALNQSLLQRAKQKFIYPKKSYKCTAFHFFFKIYKVTQRKLSSAECFTTDAMSLKLHLRDRE